jgi:hypothetical protein
LEEPTFIGVKSSNPDGIAKLLISYENADQAEEIDDLIVEFVDRPRFSTYLAQVADGPVAGVGAFQTTVIVSNLSNSTAIGELTFFDSDGEPLKVDMNGTSADRFDLLIPAYSSASFTSSGTATPVAVGYAHVTANVPVAGTALFRVVSASGEIVTEAGVGSESGKTEVVGAVQKVAAEQFDSGIAVVNVSDTDTENAQIQLYDQMGQKIDSRAIVDLIEGSTLPTGGHLARFLFQIFPQLQGQDFEGTIRILSNVPLVVVIMRAAEGLVVSSLPVGSVQK